MLTLEDYLRRNAEQWPDKVAVVLGERVEADTRCLTYAQLYDAACREADVLKTKVQARAEVFRASQNLDFLVHYFALHMAGKVAVPLERDASDAVFDEVSTLVSHSEMPDSTADVLFTTGTTGRSKGVMISHRTIVCNAENLVEAQGFSHDLVFVIAGPLNHIGSLSKIYPVILTGGTIYVTTGMKDINEFFSALSYPCTKMATFLVPASIRILLQFGKAQLAGFAHKIDFIETGAAPMAQSDMEAICAVLPHSRMYNTYASTETGIVCTHNYNSDKCIAGCLGRPMKHARVFITPDGKVACQGPTLMLGYVGDADLTSTVLRQSPSVSAADGGVDVPTLFTADNGILDDEGMLRLTGREDDVINVGGFKVSPVEVEDAALSCPGIADCICISTTHIVLGHAPKLLVVLEEGVKLDKRKIALHINATLESYKVPVAYEQVDSIRRTYNGKLDRKYYRNLTN